MNKNEVISTCYRNKCFEMALHLEVTQGNSTPQKGTV